MIGRTSPHQFRRDLLDSRAALEDLSAGSVIGYRAPTFSVTHQTAWALDVLAEAGFRYDSSIFPIHHDRYGVPDAPPGVHRAVGPGGGSVLEIPPLTWRFLGTNLPVGGGGYLRLLPAALLARRLRAAERRRGRGMIYLHPWELDPDQPVLSMGLAGTFRHRLGLRRTESKLRRLMSQFRFCDVRSTIDSLEQTTHESYRYGRGA
jgi:polysaccharide deacetylase family protein (PEP-CTERM system associated)